MHDLKVLSNVKYNYFLFVNVVTMSNIDSNNLLLLYLSLYVMYNSESETGVRLRQICSLNLRLSTVAQFRDRLKLRKESSCVQSSTSDSLTAQRCSNNERIDHRNSKRKSMQVNLNTNQLKQPSKAVLSKLGCLGPLWTSTWIPAPPNRGPLIF